MFKRILYSTGAIGALAAAYLLGGVTLGGAFAQTPPPAPTQQSAPAGSDQNDHQPSYSGSIQVPQDQSDQSEQDEAKALQSQAKITTDQAKAAALAQFPDATVGKVELDNENGSLVYSVHLTDKTGKAQDVKVDAGNGKVLHVDADGPEGLEAAEAPETAGAED